MDNRQDQSHRRRSATYRAAPLSSAAIIIRSSSSPSLPLLSDLRNCSNTENHGQSSRSRESSGSGYMPSERSPRHSNSQEIQAPNYHHRTAPQEDRSHSHVFNSVFYTGESSGRRSRDNSSQTSNWNEGVSAVRDWRMIAYAYAEVKKEKGEEQDLAQFFKEMDTDGDNGIDFQEFKIYMVSKGFAKYCSYEDFFAKMSGGRGYLKYEDVAMLLYAINSGKPPYCDNCKYVIEGSFFTCYKCFEKNEDYHYNVCPSCFVIKDKNHDPRHKEFVDPLSLLRLVAKKGYIKESKDTKPSDSSVVARRNYHPSGLLELMQIAAGCATIAAAITQCTIM